MPAKCQPSAGQMPRGTSFALDLSVDYRTLERNEAGEYQDACDITIHSKPASRCQPPLSKAWLSGWPRAGARVIAIFPRLHHYSFTHLFVQVRPSVQVEEMLDRFTRVFIILNDHDAGL